MPLRQCVGCRERTVSDRVRVVLAGDVLAGDERMLVDVRGTAPGRGAWVHARGVCLGRAMASGFARSFKRAVRLDRRVFVEEIRAAADAEVSRLLRASWLAGRLVLGLESLQERHVAGQLELVLAPCETMVTLTHSWLRDLHAGGQLVFWGTEDTLKSSMGLMATQSVTMVGVTDPRLALALRRSVSLGRLAVDPASESAHKAARRRGSPVEVQ